MLKIFKKKISVKCTFKSKLDGLQDREKMKLNTSHLYNIIESKLMKTFLKDHLHLSNCGNLK